MVGFPRICSILTFLICLDHFNNHNSNRPELYLAADPHFQSANNSTFLTETELASDINGQMLGNPSLFQASLHDLSFFDNQSHEFIDLATQSTYTEPLSFISQLDYNHLAANPNLPTDLYPNHDATNHPMIAPPWALTNGINQYSTSEGIINSGDSNQLRIDNENWANSEKISIPTIGQSQDLLQNPQDFLGDAIAEGITKSQSSNLESVDTNTGSQHHRSLPPARRGGRRGPLTSAQAEHQRQAKLLGICIRCRKTKIKVRAPCMYAGYTNSHQ